MSFMGKELALKGEARQPLQGEGHALDFSAINPSMGNGLRELRLARRWTHDEAAKAVGLSRGQFIKLERGERGLTERTIGLAAKAFAVPRAQIIGDSPIVDEAGEEAAEANVRPPGDEAPLKFSRIKGPRNVPVYGTSSGGDGGDFRFNGQLIDHAPRPPGIESRSDVYVLYVIGDSVSPKYEDGDPIYIDPHRRPQPRDYVIVELKSTEDGEVGDSYVKRLVRRTATKIIVEQHNPPKEIEFEESKVDRMHRVIPYPELIGI